MGAVIHYFQCLYISFLYHVYHLEHRKVIKSCSDSEADTCVGESADRRTVVSNLYVQVKCKMGCLELCILCGHSY